MAADDRSLTPKPLASGLARNITYNVLGGMWAALLALIIVPRVLHGIGVDSYGVFSLLTTVTGYLGLLHGPIATGNVRFMAEAYGDGDWALFRKYLFSGLMMNAVLVLAGTIVLLLLAPLLVHRVFKIPTELVGISIKSFRLAAMSFLFGGLGGALSGVPAALRRYGLVNAVGIVTATVNTILLWWAVARGWGLVGIVATQILANLLRVLAYLGIAAGIVRSIPYIHGRGTIEGGVLKRILAFSSLFFAGSVVSSVGLQLDRLLIGMLLGTTAVTYYTIPARIVDQLPGLMGRFTTALYPLAAEGMTSGRMDELRQIYARTLRVLLWLSGAVVSILITCAHSLLFLWVGPELADKSWLVLVVLSVAVIFRAPGGVAYQVCNGFGKAGLYLTVSVSSLFLLGVPVAILCVRIGAVGAALGVLIGLFFTNVFFDAFVQRRLLGLRNWARYISPYLQIIAALSITWGAASLMPQSTVSLASVCLKGLLVSVTYIVVSLVVGVLPPTYVRSALAILKVRMKANERTP